MQTVNGTKTDLVMAPGCKDKQFRWRCGGCASTAGRLVAFPGKSIRDTPVCPKCGAINVIKK